MEAPSGVLSKSEIETYLPPKGGEGGKGRPRNRARCCRGSGVEEGEGEEYSDLPPPREPNALLAWVFSGNGLYLYTR